jgi:hypothetical protein
VDKTALTDELVRKISGLIDVADRCPRESAQNTQSHAEREEFAA